MPRRSGVHSPRGNGPRGRGGGDPQARETTISKAASYVLRHGAVKEGVRLDENGYANVADLVWIFFFCLVEFTSEIFFLRVVREDGFLGGRGISFYVFSVG